MNTRNTLLNLLVIALVVFVLGFSGVAVTAQDVTETAAPVTDVVVVPTEAVTVEATEVIQFPDPAIENPGDFSNAGATWFLLLGLGIVSGIGIGAGGVVIIINFLGTKAARDEGEKMYEALSPAAQERFLEMIGKYETITTTVIRGHEALLAYMKAITDGKPNEVG